MKIAVLLETDHASKLDAAESVVNSLKRAGYDVNDVAVAADDNQCFEVTAFVHVAIDACEPEISEREHG